MQIDITSLTEAQLEAFKAIDAQAVSTELARRSAYQSITEFLTELAQAGADLSVIAEQVRDTQAFKAVKATNIIKIIERGLGYARNNNLTFDPPEVRPIIVPKFSRAKSNA